MAVIRPRPPAPLLLLALASSLAGCGNLGEQDAFAPECPRAAILGDAADLSRYSGRGADLTDLVLDGRITGLAGHCERGDKDRLNTAVAVSMQLQRGPAARGRAAEVAYFVSVVEGDRILDKRVFPVRAEFPPNTDTIRVTGDEVDMSLPTPANRSGAAYRVLVGFQLQPDELALNRRRGPR